MPYTMFRTQRRLRSKNELAHKPSGHGKGKWHSRTTLWTARGLRRIKNKIASKSRKINLDRLAA